MNREEALGQSPQRKTYDELRALFDALDESFRTQLNRSLPMADALNDRWDRARKLGFGTGTSIYDSALVLGDVKVGSNCWIGPGTVIDGSGGLIIGDHCTVSAGVHIYSHDNIKQTLTGGKLPIERTPVSIGNNTYIGPDSIIVKGVQIGNQCVVATNSFVNKHVPDNTIVGGNPARILGTVRIEQDEVFFDFAKD
jgi:acetyltransferase-like isoleucine patch superfamily enzyme